VQHGAQKVFGTELSPVSFLRRSAFVDPDEVAVVHGDRRYRYRELDERVKRLASALDRAGVETGDRVAFLRPNIPALLEAHFAVPAAGAVLVAINTRLAAREVAAIIEHSGARIVFCDHELTELVEGCDVAVVRVTTPESRVIPTRIFSRRAARRRSSGRSWTRSRRSRSTTPRARPGDPGESCTPTGARTSTR
jgi:acyl-CoA synthetase (AMP-forming)/AMP-acid ligase II